MFLVWEFSTAVLTGNWLCDNEKLLTNLISGKPLDTTVSNVASPEVSSIYLIVPSLVFLSLSSERAWADSGSTFET